MAKQVEILSLNINNDLLVKKLSETKAQIEQLQASQKSLTAQGKSSSVEFIQQAAQLKNLQNQYNSQFNVVTQLTAAKKNAENVSDALNQALHEESLSIAQATANNKQLREIRNQLNATTEEGAAAIELINQKLQENTAFIQENVSGYEQQKMAIGDYSNQIQDALSNLNPFNGGISGFISRSKEAGGAGNLLTESFKGMTVGMYGMIKAGLAFIATPIGAAIAILAVAIGAVVGAFKFMTASMNSTEEGSQKLAKVTATVTGVFNGFWKLIKPLGEFMGNAFIKYFEMAAAAVEATVGAVSSGLKFLGFDDAAKSVDGFANSIKQSAQDAANLAQAEGELDKMQRKSKITQLDYQKQAEKLRQQRDDESNSISERITLNNQLGEVLKKQLADELLIAQQALKVANLRIQSEGRTKETLDGQAEALAEIADIQERLTGQESEQLANQNSLRKEAADAEKERQAKAAEARQKAVDKAIQQNKDEIDLFIAQQGIKKKALADELAFEEQLSKKRLALLEREYKAGKMSKTAYETEKLNISNEFLKKQMDSIVAEAQRELDLYKMSIEQKKADDKFFTEDKLLAKQTEDNTLAMKERDFQLLRKEQGQINEQEYLDAINLINENNRVKNEEAEKIREEAKKEQKLIDLENQRIIDEEKFTNDFDRQIEDERIRYEAEKKAAETNGANLNLIEQKHATANKKINETKEAAKRQAAADTLGDLASLLGEETAAGKAAAIAQATINTYSGIAQVWGADSVLPEPFATAAKVVSTGVVLASGLGAVKKITSTKTPQLAGGGIVPKLSSGVINNGANLEIPLTNGDDTLAYLTQGELVLSQKQQADMGGSAFFRSHKIPGFANGGLVGGTSNLGSQGGIKIDMDLLAQKIGEQVGRANASLPAPRVGVDTITQAQNYQVRIESGANF